MNVLLVGGHITPLMATIGELKKKPHVTIRVVTRRYSSEGAKHPSVESQLLAQEQIPVDYISTGKLQRHFTIHTVPSLLKIPIGFIQALALCIKHRPNVIVSFGGYLGVPVCLAGFLLRIPIVLHEQSTQAGLANRISARFAKTICISWETSKTKFPARKTVLTGNPVRSAIFHMQAKSTAIEEFLQKQSLPLLYITGGNQGSHAINAVIFSGLPKLLAIYCVVHQIGIANKADFTKAAELKKQLSQELQGRYFAEQYFDSGDVGAVLHKAKIVVSRAGANTVSELIALNKPAVFIPLPWTQKNEQMENAKVVTQVGGGRILEQQDLTKDSLLDTLAEMHSHYDSYVKNLLTIKQLVPQDAAQKIADQIEQAAS